MRSLTWLAVLGPLALAGCPQLACTEIGCENLLEAGVGGGVLHGDLTFEAEDSAGVASCVVTLPGDPDATLDCGGRASIVLDGDGEAVRFDVRGGQDGDPIELRILDDTGAVLHDSTFDVDYPDDLRPNGDDCPPACGTVAVDFVDG